MPDGNVGDLALLEEAMADEIANPLTFFIREEADRSVDMRQIVLRLRNLRLIGADPAMDLRTLVLKSLDDEWIRHAPLNSRHDQSSRTARGALAS